MAVRSLNKVMLIGNLTRDPELRYTPAGTAVCTFGLATNRSWVTQSGETKEDVEFHRIVAWNKLAELCSQLLAKGRKVYVEGRLSTHTWTGQDGVQRSSTEIVIEDMIILDSKRIIREEAVSIGPEEVPTEIPASPVLATSAAQSLVPQVAPAQVPSDQVASVQPPKAVQADSAKAGKKAGKKEEKKEEKVEEKNEEITPDDIPF